MEIIPRFDASWDYVVAIFFASSTRLQYKLFNLINIRNKTAAEYWNEIPRETYVQDKDVTIFSDYNYVIYVVFTSFLLKSFHFSSIGKWRE